MVDPFALAAPSLHERAAGPRSAGSAAVARPTETLRTEWARTRAATQEAQRLRFQVFALELGAQLEPSSGPAHDALDVDRYDEFCEHLLVRAGDGRVVGTCRVLTPEAAIAAGGSYADSEFDLTALAPLRPHALELGRSCVHPHWRTGGVVLAMWSALAARMAERGFDTLIGCASVSLLQGATPMLRLWEQLRRTHMAEPRWWVRPWRELQPSDSDEHRRRDSRSEVPLAMPPLLKGYLRCGARLLGPPAFDAVFDTADLPIMLRLPDMAPRYRRHLLHRG